MFNPWEVLAIIHIGTASDEPIQPAENKPYT